MKIALDLDVEELAMAAGTDDLLARRRRHRWIECLQCADRRDIDAFDQVSSRTLAHVRGESFDLRKFGHALKCAVVLAAPITWREVIGISRSSAGDQCGSSGRDADTTMKVVVAHNRYTAAQPSGEN